MAPQGAKMTDFSIYEVGPRDGLQSADTIMPTASKVEMIERLAQCGIRSMEVGAMVSPEKVPNMADSGKVYSQVSYLEPDVTLGMLVPNAKGVERAKAVGVNKFNVFFSPSDYFNINNHGRTLNFIFSEYVSALHKVDKSDVRVYVSTAFGCPGVGEIPKDVMKRALSWADSLGSTIVLSDTTGKANPMKISKLMSDISDMQIKADIALHLHHGPRRNRMLDNLSAAFDSGIRQFDSSINGLGGCPFIPGSGGNLATEELVAWGERERLDSGINLEDLKPVSKFVDAKLGF